MPSMADHRDHNIRPRQSRLELLGKFLAYFDVLDVREDCRANVLLGRAWIPLLKCFLERIPKSTSGSDGVPPTITDEDARQGVSAACLENTVVIHCSRVSCLTTDCWRQGSGLSAAEGLGNDGARAASSVAKAGRHRG